MKFGLLLLASIAAPVAASTVSASSAAEAWLKSHQMPNQDQLSELAGSNPEAYAIVNALLTKHSHGTAKLSADEKGPDVFRRMMGTPHLAAAATATRVEVPYASSDVAEVSAPVVDQAHYDPNAAANRDESSVSRLLAAVANMGGEKGKKIAALMKKRHVQKQDENALQADAALFAEEKPTPEPAAASVTEKPHKKVNSWLNGMDLSGDLPVVLKGEPKQEEKPAAADDSSDTSSDLSFQDALSQQAEKPKQVVQATEAPKPKKENSVFLKWLGVTDKAPAPTEQPKPAKKQNSYLASIKFFG